MGKGARNRAIRREAHDIAVAHGGVENEKRIARWYRRALVDLRRSKAPSRAVGDKVLGGRYTSMNHRQRAKRAKQLRHQARRPVLAPQPAPVPQKVSWWRRFFRWLSGG